jgi:hypothetical protein
MKRPIAPDTSMEDPELATARQVSGDSGWDFLEQVPFENIYQQLITYACSTLRLAASPWVSPPVIAAVLRALPRDRVDDFDETEFHRRADAGDLSVLSDHTVAEFDWQEIAAHFVHLFMFARHGEVSGRGDEPMAEIRRKIEALLEHFRQVVRDPGVRQAVRQDFEWLEDTLFAAEGRWALDNGRPLVPNDLAALAGVKPKTMANALAAGQLAVDANGKVPSVRAARYLEGRKSFQPSVWNVATMEMLKSPELKNGLDEASKQLFEQIFVPVEQDGRPFLPSDARMGHDGVRRYIIGDKADPIYLEDYWDALEQLRQMPTPRWRRPASGAGGWSLVSAQDGWERFSRGDLQRMIDAARNQ